MRNATRLLTATMAAVVLCAGPALGAEPPTKTITLALKKPPKGEAAQPPLSALSPEGPLKLDVVDARGAADPLVVGAQKERSNTVYVWRSDAPVGLATARFIADILRGWSVAVAPDAARTLAIRLTRYEILEKSETIGSLYKAEVALEAKVVDAEGRTISASTGEGAAKQSGPDARESQANEVLSAALRQALAKALAAAPETPPTAPPPAPGALAPSKLLEDLVRMKEAGVGDEILASYVKKQTLALPLTAADIVAWKEKGIPEAAIQAALDK